MFARILSIVPVLALLLPAQPRAQSRPPTRDGFWFNGGLGVASAGCDGCNGRQRAVTVALGVGGTVSRTVLLGASLDAWTKSGTGGLTVATLLARIRFYPSGASGFFMTGGIGLGRVTANATDIGSRSNTGTGALLGLGWDFRVGTNVSLTPFWNGFSTGSLKPNFNGAQLGLSVTAH